MVSMNMESRLMYFLASVPFLPDERGIRRSQVRFLRLFVNERTYRPPSMTWKTGEMKDMAADEFDRQFLQKSYPVMKKHNPTTPLLVREAFGVPPKIWARYGNGNPCRRGSFCRVRFADDAQSWARRRVSGSMDLVLAR